jgi:hypothetical protein
MAKRRKRSKAPQPPTPRPFRRAVKKVGTIVGGVVTVVVTVLALYQAFGPVISFSVGQPRDPKDPFSFPFIATNDSPLPLFSVVLTCSYDEVEFAGALYKNIVVLSSPRSSPRLRFFAPKQSTTAPCHTAIEERGSPFRRARATIIAHYKVLGLYAPVV